MLRGVIFKLWATGVLWRWGGGDGGLEKKKTMGSSSFFKKWNFACLQHLLMILLGKNVALGFMGHLNWDLTPGDAVLRPRHWCLKVGISGTELLYLEICFEMGLEVRMFGWSQVRNDLRVNPYQSTMHNTDYQCKARQLGLHSSRKNLSTWDHFCWLSNSEYGKGCLLAFSIILPFYMMPVVGAFSCFSIWTIITVIIPIYEVEEDRLKVIRFLYFC